MKIVFTRVTWYSKVLAVIVFVGFIAAAFILGVQYGRLSEKAARAPSTPAQTAVEGQYEIRATDNGRIFEYPITSRVSVILDENKYPKNNLSCSPEGLLGSISNIPSVMAPLYVVRYEILTTGQCLLRDGDFSVVIVGVE